MGIEATSFRHGLVHETLLDMDVLVGDGSIRTAKPDNEHADLFFGFPNSYGTLGYALRLRARTLSVQPFVTVEHRRFARADVFFDALIQACASDAHFVDAAVFGPDSLVLNLGRFSASAPFTSDYTFERDEFVRLYGGEAYRVLKTRYDPAGRLGDLYAKCVLRQ